MVDRLPSISTTTKAGLTGKDNWKNYPRQMLRARVVSEGVRTVYPAVCVGVYTPEEFQNFDPAQPQRGRPRKEKDITEDATVVDDRAAGSGQGASSSLAPEPSTAASAPAETRTETLRRWCNDAHMKVADLLSKAGVQSAEEMAEDDWQSAMRMLKKKAASVGKAMA